MTACLAGRFHRNKVDIVFQKRKQPVFQLVGKGFIEGCKAGDIALRARFLRELVFQPFSNKTAFRLYFFLKKTGKMRLELIKQGIEAFYLIALKKICLFMLHPTVALRELRLFSRGAASCRWG